MFSVLSTVLMATAAFVPGAQAGLSASSKGTRHGTTTTKRDPVHYKSSKESSVVCKSTATAVSYSKSADGFASAMADAFKYGCSLKLDDKWSVMVDYMHDYDDAYAFAYAAASTSAECKSTGNAYGCAAAYANAKAWADAVLEVWAGAWATAINYCDCGGKGGNVAIATNYGKAHEFERLVAEVEAEAHSKVCVYGDDEAVATADSYCLHSIYAVGFAKAFALALIDGQCYDYHYDGGLDATAISAAKAKIERWDYIDC